MSKSQIALVSLFFLSLGIVIGGYLFSQSQPRSLLSIRQCQNCLSRKDLCGLLASVGIQNFSAVIPFVVFETDKTIAVKLPFRKAPIHYFIIPKKDINNIGELSQEDIPYLNDMFFVIRHIIENDKLSKYRLYTNGPGYQDMSYLHFHLVAD
jgi:Scavenger mRNA decapping enzyme C-term binding